MTFDTDRINQDGYWDILCPECSTWFQAKRVTATFCSSTCRSRWSRFPAKRLAQIKKTNEAVYDLLRNMPKSGESKEFLALHRLATVIKNALDLVES